MIFWHLGITVLIARYVFRDPNMDLRWLMLGSLLPDVIDKPKTPQRNKRARQIWCSSEIRAD